MTRRSYNMEKTKEKLTKKELNNLFFRFCQYNAPGFDYVYYMGKSWPWWLKPLFKKYYDKEEYSKALTRHFDFYNTENTTGALVYGVVVGLEEQKALTGKVPEESIKDIKVSLQGPIAGIGDSLIQGTLLPILITIAMSLSGDNGSIAGPLFYIVALFGILIPYMYILFNKGYQLGTKAISAISSGSLKRVTEAISSFGLIVIGALAAKQCGVSTSLSYMSNGEPVMLIDKINSIFPNLLSLLVIFLMYYLMKKKKVSSAIIVYATLVVVVVLALLGIA